MMNLRSRTLSLLTFIKQHFSFFPWFNKAWDSYKQCRSMLWWPLSFLLLTPLAVIILFGVIVPFGLNGLGWVSFDYKILNIPYLILVAGLTFCALFPFFDGVYQLIQTHLEGKPITEDTGFINLFNSQAMGKAIGPVLAAIIVLELICSLFKPLNILVLLAYTLTIFTPILLINDEQTPWKKGLDSIYFALENKKLVAKVWGLRLIILLSLIVPWKIVGFAGSHLVLKILLLSLVLPAFSYIVIKILPFYFFYPAFVYEQMKEAKALTNHS